MSIAFVAAGTVTTGAASLAVPYPASIAAGQLLILSIANKYPTNTPITPSGWIAPANNQFSGGAGGAAEDTGSVYITVYLKIADGTETGNVTVTLTGANSSVARIFSYSKDSDKTWEYVLAGGSDNAAGTSWSVTGGSDPGVQLGDMLLVASALNGQPMTATVEAVSQTGVTFGTMVERQDSGTTVGDDSSLWFTEHPVTAGASIAAPVYSATVGGTASATAAGAILFLRLREAPVVSLSGAGTVSASPRGSGSASLSGAGTLTANADFSASAAASLSGVASLTANASSQASASLAGSASLTANAEFDSGAIEASAAITGTGTIEAIASVAGTVALTGAATISAIGRLVKLYSPVDLTIEIVQNRLEIAVIQPILRIDVETVEAALTMEVL